MALAPELIDAVGVRPGKLLSARLDLTTDCNLRCVYCTRSRPGYPVVNMSSRTFGRVLAGLAGHPDLEFIEINGHGETTVHPKWRALCSLLFREGHNVSITSNFAKTFDPVEIELLSRFTSVIISMDSCDRLELKRLRRKVDLGGILYNMTAVRARAMKDCRRPPDFGLSCGLYDQSVMGMEDLARFAVVMGVKNVIFWNLTPHQDLPDVDNPRPLASLEGDALVRALQAIDGAERIMRQFGVKTHYGGDFVDRLRVRAAGGREPDSLVQPAEPAPGSMTRCCTNPWRHVEFSPQGAVTYCCDYPAVGELGAAGLEAVRDNEASRRLRRSLLTGELDAHCRRCPVKPMIPTSEFLSRFE